MSRPSQFVVMGMIGVVWLFVGRTFAAGDDVNLAERANRVKQMTAEDRARLQKNIETFRQLTAEERAAYRHLSATVESDPGLKQLMATYTAWLQTLTPGQREELRLERDINKRRDLVEKFRKEQVEKEEMPLPELESGSRNPWQVPTLESSELLAVLDLVKNALPEDRKARLPEARDEIGRLEQAWAIAGNLWRPPVEAGTIVLPFEKMLDVVETPAVRDFLSTPDRQRALWGAWAGVIGRSLFQEIHREIEKRTPDDATLVKYFSDLEPSQRFELNQLTRDDWRREMIRTYFNKHPDPDFERLMQLRPGRRPGDRSSGSDGRGPGFPPRNGDGGGPQRPGERIRGFLDNGPPGGPRPPGPPPGDAK